MNREERIEREGLEVEPIEFYAPRDPYGCFSNFSTHTLILLHPFTGEEVGYASGEHRFQAMKATTRKEHDWVRDATRPSDAKRRGREVNLREGWGDDYGDLCWYVMLETVMAKARQHYRVWDELEATGDRAIWEDSPVDDIWGVQFRGDYRGKNLLGRCWMETRLILGGSG